MKLSSIVSLPHAANFSQSLADSLQIPCYLATVVDFPDGEIKVTLQEPPRDGVLIIQSFAHRVNQALIELFLAVDALKRAGILSVYLVAPYFPYSRQTKTGRSYKGDLRKNIVEDSFDNCESVASRLFAKFFEVSGLTGLIALDLHDQHVASFYDFKVVQLSAAHLLAQSFQNTLSKKDGVSNICVVAPDEGASRLAASYASFLGASCAVVQKHRVDAEHVKVVSLLGDVQGKTVLLADDVCSTASTLTSAAKVCHEKGAKKVYAAVSHGLFVGQAQQLLRDSCIEQLWITDSCIATRFHRGDQAKKLVQDESLLHTLPVFEKNSHFLAKLCICPTLPLFSSFLRQYL